MKKIRSIFIDNDLYKSNDDGTMIFSRDGSELVHVICSLKHIKIPDGVRIIKEHAFEYSSIKGRLIIPASVEIIENRAFRLCSVDVVKFRKGSQLKSLGTDTFRLLDNLIISNENFIKLNNGVVMSLSPKGIVFVPKKLTELTVDSDVEVIHSWVFNDRKIKTLHLPKSLKIIGDAAFYYSNLSVIDFEEGTEIDYFDGSAFDNTRLQEIKLPLVKFKMEQFCTIDFLYKIEFPPNFKPQIIKNCSFTPCLFLKKVVCPRSSLPSVALIDFSDSVSFEIIEDL